METGLRSWPVVDVVVGGGRGRGEEAGGRREGDRVER